MPTYDYICEACRKKVSVFFLSIRRAEEETHRCPLCQGEKLRRLVSRFAVVRSTGSIMDAGSPDEIPGMSELESGDPRALARFMRRMSDEAGEPIEPEMENVLDRLESGEDPEKIESDLGEGGPGGGPALPPSSDGV